VVQTKDVAGGGLIVQARRDGASVDWPLRSARRTAGQRPRLRVLARLPADVARSLTAPHDLLERPDSSPL